MGLEVKLIIARKEDIDDDDDDNVENENVVENKRNNSNSGDNNGGDDVDADVGVDAGEEDPTMTDDDDDDDVFTMQVESSGKFSRKANWADLNRFTGKDITSDVLRDMIVKYQETCFPDGKLVAYMHRYMHAWMSIPLT
jgi:hypothetical protein